MTPAPGETFQVSEPNPDPDKYPTRWHAARIGPGLLCRSIRDDTRRDTATWLRGVADVNCGPCRQRLKAEASAS